MEILPERKLALNAAFQKEKKKNIIKPIKQ